MYKAFRYTSLRQLRSTNQTSHREVHKLVRIRHQVVHNYSEIWMGDLVGLFAILFGPTKYFPLYFACSAYHFSRSTNVLWSYVVPPNLVPGMRPGGGTLPNFFKLMEHHDSRDDIPVAGVAAFLGNRISNNQFLLHRNRLGLPPREAKGKRLEAHFRSFKL